MMNYYTAIGKLIRNAVAFRWARVRKQPLKPESVSLALTIRCNSHCIMCNMWREAKDIPDIIERELTADEIIGLLSAPVLSDLVEIDLTGGEPFLRKDLTDILAGIIKVKKSGLKRLKSIILTSNGFMPERIITGYKDFLETSRDIDVDFVHVASLDGIGEVHDKIRGTRGAFELAAKTLDGLLELKNDFPRLYIGVKATVLPQNIDSLQDVLEFAEEKGLFHIISPAFFTPARFRNPEKESALQLNTSHHAQLLEFYRQPAFSGNYFYSRIRELLSTEQRNWTCTAAYNYLFIDYDGSVFPCELLNNSIGNVKEKSIEDIWNGALADECRGKINRTDSCLACIEPGAVRYSAVREGLSYAGYLRGLGRKNYTQSLLNEGYSKYLR